jgi:hypothetical protein
MKRIATFISLLIVVSLMLSSVATADHIRVDFQNQDYTAYANLNRYGAGGSEAVLGDVAVHQDPKGCSNCPVLPVRHTNLPSCSDIGRDSKWYWISLDLLLLSRIRHR